MPVGATVVRRLGCNVPVAPELLALGLPRTRHDAGKGPAQWNLGTMVEMPVGNGGAVQKQKS